MSYPHAYTLTTTSSLAASSAFQGKSSQPTVVALDTASNQDNYVSNGYAVPSSVPSFTNAGHNAVARFPCHGRREASNFYFPTPMIHQPLTSSVPVTTTSPEIKSKGHATSLVPFYVQDTLSFFRDAVSKLSDAGLQASATAFLNSVEAGLVTTYGQPTNVNATGDFICDNQTVAAGSNHLSVGAATIGTSSGVTRIFSFGDIQASAIATGTAASDYVIIFAVGQVVFTGATWNTNGGSNPRKILIIATGDIGCSGVAGTFGSLDFITSSATVTVNGGSATSPSVGNNYIAANNTTTASYLYDPYATGSAQPGLVPYPVQAFADKHWFDIVGDTTSIQFDVPVGALITTFSGTTAYYNMTASSSAWVDSDWLDVAVNILARLCCQHQVVPQITDLEHSVLLQAGCYYLFSTAFGFDRTTALSFQKSTNQVPNFGISTEGHDFDNFFTPDTSLTTALWLKTYRVADLIWAPMKGTTATSPSARYMTVNGANRIDGMVGPSTVDYVFQAPPYTIETTDVEADCLVSVSNNGTAQSLPNGATDGGQDPYTSISGSGSASFQASSTYRLLTPVLATPSGATASRMVIPSQSYGDWAPLNGEVVLVAGTSTAPTGIFRADMFPNRKATIAQFTLTCQPSSVAGETMNTAYNAGQVVPGPILKETILFKSADRIRFSLQTSSASEVYVMASGDKRLIGSAEYEYVATSSSALFTKVSSGVKQYYVSGAWQTTVATSSWTFGAVPATMTIFLTVVFGDTLMDNTLFVANAIIDGSVPSNYFVREVAEVDFHATRVQASAGSLLYLPALSDTTKASLAQLGVEEVSPDYWQDKVFHQEANFFPEVVIDGKRVSIYSGNPATTRVAIGLADGTYTNDNGDSVIVANGTILASALPLTTGFITYVAVQLPSVSGNTVVTIGVDYADFDSAATALGLNRLRRGQHQGLTLQPGYSSGPKKDVFSGSGSVFYEDGMGGTYQIVFP